MSNFTEDEKSKIVLLENALRRRNAVIRKLEDKIVAMDKDYNALNATTKRLHAEVALLTDTLSKCLG